MKRIYRSRTDKVISGVCGGLGKYFGIDPTIVRIVWAVFFFAMGTGILAYIIAMIIIPVEPLEGEPEVTKPDGTVDLYKSEQASVNVNSKTLLLVIGSIILLVGILFLIGNIFGAVGWVFSIGSKIFWPLVIIGAGVAVLIGYFRK